MLAESVPSEHPGDVYNKNEHVERVWAKVPELMEQMASQVTSQMTSQIEDLRSIQMKQDEKLEEMNKEINRMEIEHPQKLECSIPSPSAAEVPGPSASPTHGTQKNIQSAVIDQPGPSTSSTGVSTVTVEEKISQHTQVRFQTAIERLYASLSMIELISD